MTSSARSIPLVKVPYSLLTFWWFLFPSVHSSSLSLFESAASLEKRTVLLVVVTLLPLVEGVLLLLLKEEEEEEEREERRESWNVTKREKKSAKQTNENKTKKRNKEKNLIEENFGFFCFLPFFSLFLSFFLSRDASLLTFYACSHSNNIL